MKIKGSHFGVSQGESRVTFNGVSAAPVSWSDTKIKAPVPVGAATGPVVVTVNGQASSGIEFTVGGPAPVIGKLKPKSGYVGTVVKIKGVAFRGLPGRQHGDLQWGELLRTGQLERYQDQGAGARWSVDGPAGSDGQWAGEQRSRVHRGRTGAGNPQVEARFGRGGGRW